MKDKRVFLTLWRLRGRRSPSVRCGMDGPLTTGFYVKKNIALLMPNLEKNAKIREKRKQTLIRRRTQEAKTFELKLDKSKISKTTLAVLNRFFS